MKKHVNIVCLPVLCTILVILNGIVYIFGARPKLIKNKLLIGSIILTFFVIGAKKTMAQRTCYKVSNTNPPKEITYTKVDSMPAFPGGQDSCDTFILKHINYKLCNDIQGTVYVNFVVEPNGLLTNVNVKKGIGGRCDEEAIRIVKLMPNWIPGKQNGIAVKVLYTLEVKFE